ncbi:hypothetical protein [Mycobacterium sp. DL592]|uniref:hypothetical protein n=1 Tax=Mycobacterium sp. DL592 TaxID=2675524 RepID=UPI00141D9FB8|nr:hypothetical protein [Mycobacterium sp. DL592]
MEFLKYGVGWIIAIGFGAAGVYYFLYNRRRKKLEVNGRSGSLRLPTAEKAAGDLRITFNEDAIDDPHIFEFSVTNTGHKDIASKDFDGGVPYSVDLGAKIVARLQIPGLQNTAAAFQISEENYQTIVLKPSKIAVGSTLKIRVLLDGRPNVTYGENPLIDTDIVRGKSERAKAQKAVRRMMLALIPLSLVIALLSIIPQLFLDNSRARKTSWWIFHDIVASPTWALACSLSGAALVPLALALTFFVFYKTQKLASMNRRVVELG